MRKKSRRPAAIAGAAVISLLVFWSTTAAGEDVERYQLNIASQNAGQALRALANATGKQLLFPYNKVKTSTSPLVLGHYTVEDALKIILKDTSLSGELTQEGVIVVAPRQKKK